MNLDIQIRLIIFSCIYGIVFALLLDLNYKLLHHKNKIIKYLSSFIYIAICVFVYFKGIQKISYGIFHLYSLFLIGLGFILENIIFKTIEKKLRKWYNSNIIGDINEE